MLRCVFWLVVWVLTAFASLYYQYLSSKRAYDKGDKSAMAWVGFLPFLMPIFFVHSACIIGPIMIVVELIRFCTGI